jgi:hypothetical protein
MTPRIAVALAMLGVALNVATLLVRHGSDARRKRDRETGARTHTLVPVYCEMLGQICRDYSSLPNPRTLTQSEIRFWYEGLRPELRAHTKPKSK